jgi:hypothetical protein
LLAFLNLRIHGFYLFWTIVSEYFFISLSLPFLLSSQGTPNTYSVSTCVNNFSIHIVLCYNLGYFFQLDIFPLLLLKGFKLLILISSIFPNTNDHLWCILFYLMLLFFSRYKYAKNIIFIFYLLKITLFQIFVCLIMLFIISDGLLMILYILVWFWIILIIRSALVEFYMWQCFDLCVEGHASRELFTLIHLQTLAIRTTLN